MTAEAGAMILYDYWRSTAAFRVRIALELKHVDVERRFVHLLRDGGEQKLAAYRARNPQGLVPALELDDGSVLTQSLAIVDYLDAIAPDALLVPADPLLAARARAVALAIACDIHPLGNLRVAAYLEERFAASPEAVAAWRRHWISEGFEAIERLIEPAPFAFGAQPCVADLCIAPQVFAARRFGVALDRFPGIAAVAAACDAHPAFRAAHPDRQPDAGASVSSP
jgi:maleylacetoacetate isomerase